MADISMNPGAPPVASGPPPLPPRAAAPAPAEAPASDRVTLQSADDGARSYKLEKDGSGVQYQTWQARSGVKYEVASTPQGTQFRAEIPQGMTQEPLTIEGAYGPQGTAVFAAPSSNPERASQAQVTPDGKIMINLSPNGPVALFDPASLDFGVATPPQQQMGPNGTPMTMQALQEVVHADNSRTIKAGAVIQDVAGGMSMWTMMPTAPHREVSYIEVNDKNGQVTARQVTEKLPLQNQQGGGWMNDLMGSMGSMSGPQRSETALTVAKQPDGSYTLGGTGLLGHMKNALKNPMSLQSPMGNWMKDRNKGPQLLHTFHSNPVILSAMGATAGPAAAMAAQAPFAQGNTVPPPPGIPVR